MKENKLFAYTLTLIAFVMVLSFTLAANAEPEIDDFYSLTTVVVNIVEDENLVVCEDFIGNVWEFEGIEEWDIGDIAFLLMFCNETDEIEDDEIVNAFYGGYIDIDYWMAR